MATTKIDKKNFKKLLMKSAKEAADHAEGKITLRESSQINPAPEYTSTQVKKIRKNINVSQRVFANLLNVNFKTVQAWEGGTSRPNKSSQRILQIMEKEPHWYLNFLDRVSS